MSRSSLRRWRATAPIVVIAVVTTLAACSTEVEVRTTATGESSPTPAADTGDPPGPDAVATPPADDDAVGSGDPADGGDGDGDDGDDGDVGSADPDAEAPLRTPARGEAVAVVGVAFDETIAVRAAPRPSARVVTELPARFDEAIGTGQARTDATTGWWEILVGDDRGWVDAASMARLGATTEVTADVVEALGATPAAPTMRALGRLVAEARVGDDADGDGDGDGRIVLSGAPVAGDLGEVVYDVVGRADASVAGERLVVFGVPADDSDGFVLRSVESTTFCARGVTADGRCT
jgi:hypothetical protein